MQELARLGLTNLAAVTLTVRNGSLALPGLDAGGPNGQVGAMSHLHMIRVYHEDVDLAGIVYYANYLKFIERGRSEWVRSLGIDQAALLAGQGLVFAVRRVVADYLRPARFGDELTVETGLQVMTGARIVVHQRVLRGDDPLFTAEVVLVCLGSGGQALPVPAAIRALLGAG